jgi:hypothetical protein
MTIKSLSYLSSKSQSPVSTYTKNNRRVTEGYDASNASFWYRIELGQVREFSSRLAMEKALDLELTPIVRIPDLPQLPANIPTDTRRPARKSRSLAWILTTYPKHIPSQGVICLPSSEREAIRLTSAQRALEHYQIEFLKEANDYFQALCAMDNAQLTPREKRNLKWNMDCHFQNMSHKAFTYAQLMGQGVH